MFDAADGLLDDLLQSPAILHRHRDTNLILVDGGIGDGGHAVAQRHYRRIAGRLIAELLDARGALEPPI